MPPRTKDAGADQRSRPSFTGLVVAAFFAIGLVMGTEPPAGHANGAGTARCKVGQTPAVVVGRRMCLHVGKRCATAQDRLYHRYRYHCVEGRLGRRHRPTPAKQHLIAVRTVDGQGELFNRVAGAKFVPRGNNYIRLGPQRNASGGTQVYHSTFNVGRYDGGRAETALSRMATDGYNVIRVFVSEICVDECAGDPRTGSLRTTYIANLVDFLRRAKKHGVFVLLTNDWLPPNTTYVSDLAGVRREWFDDVNQLFLSPQGIVAQRHLWTDLERGQRPLGQSTFQPHDRTGQGASPPKRPNGRHLRL